MRHTRARIVVDFAVPRGSILGNFGEAIRCRVRLRHTGHMWNFRWRKRLREWPEVDIYDEEPVDFEVRPGQAIPLLLWTDYGGGPLWYRSPDNKAAGEISAVSLPLSDSLCARLSTWAEGDQHLWSEVVLGYELDDPVQEQAWHDEGLRLLRELRSELGPGFDIKFKHDLDA
jgi:hypothetical protein